MQVGVLGTGIVGRTLASRLLELGHHVTLGSRTKGNDAAMQWLAQAGEGAPGRAQIGTFGDAAGPADLVINATAGMASISALMQAGADAINGKPLIDVSNALDFSHGFPPRLFVSNDDSLGEQIQAAFPDALVVKSLNTVTAAVMVNPSLVPGHHVVFVAGNDDGAKQTVSALLGEFGWAPDQIIDLGDITAARAAEMYLPLWLRLMGATNTPYFNIDLIKQS